MICALYDVCMYIYKVNKDYYYYYCLYIVIFKFTGERKHTFTTQYPYAIHVFVLDGSLAIKKQNLVDYQHQVMLMQLNQPDHCMP